MIQRSVKQNLCSWRLFLTPTFFSFVAADEEKLDERAKLSVAAKRSLFRVSFYCWASYIVRVHAASKLRKNFIPVMGMIVDSGINKVF